LLRESYQSLYDQGYSDPFRPGMSATVDIQTNTVTNVLAAPIQAVTTRADSVLSDTLGGKQLAMNEGKSAEDLVELVFMVKDGKAEVRKVKTGIQDDNYIEIVEGLADDDEIIVAPYNAVSKKLKPGIAVEVVKKEDLFKTEKKKKKE
jgi:HlyD family secretion protein